MAQTLDSPVLAWNQFLDVAEMIRPVFSAADLCGLFRFPMVPAKVLAAVGRRGEWLLPAERVRAGERWDEWADSDGGEELGTHQTSV